MGWSGFFKKNFRHSQIPASVREMADQHGIERRVFARVQTPNMFHSFDPVLVASGCRLRIVNISEGGVCIADPEQLFSPEMGQIVQVTLVVNGVEHEVTLRLVGLSGPTNRHFEFIAVEHRLIEPLHQIVVYGVLGASLARCSETSEEEKAVIQMASAEFWLAPGGHNLVFHQSRSLQGEFYFFGQSFAFSVLPSGHLSFPFADKIFFMVTALANVPRPSPLILDLQESLAVLLDEHNSRRVSA